MIAALLSFYDESPAQLQATVASLAKLHVTHLVAVDGAYALFPEGEASSPSDQHRAVTEAAADIGIGCTLHVPAGPWQGNEVQKRTFMFGLAEQHTTGWDWYVVIDSDEVILDQPHPDLPSLLDGSGFDVAQCTLVEDTGEIAFPMFFRAVRGLHCHRNHYTYRAPDGRLLWGSVVLAQLEPRLDLGEVRVEHRPRNPQRAAQARTYYAARDKLRVEAGDCARCSSAATKTLPFGWELCVGGVASGWVEACPDHIGEIQAEGREQLRRLGFDPDGVEIELHRGQPIMA